MRALRKRDLSLLICVVIACLGCVGTRTKAAEDPTGRATVISADTNDLRWDLARPFTFSWQSCRVSAEVASSAQNGVTDPNAPLRTVTLSVNVDWEPLEAKKLVMIDLGGPQVYELFDEQGNPIEYRNTLSDQVRSYDWIEWMWGRSSGSFVAYLSGELNPFSIGFELSGDPNQPLPSSISLLQAYIYAIYADDVVNVDVPYDPNASWVEFASVPDLMFYLDTRTAPRPAPVEYINLSPTGADTGPFRPKALGLYRYKTWVKTKTETPVFGPCDGRYPSDVFGLQQYVVIRTRLYDSVRKRNIGFSSQSVLGDLTGSRGACCLGEFGQSGDEGCDYNMIRHIVAVHPVEVKIPFVLTNIPVPTLQSVAK
jgi:hypothetical protein